MMKKLSGWLLIIFCSVFLLIFAIAIIAILPGILTQYSEIQMSANELLSISIGLLIVISLLIFGLRNGVIRLRKEKIIDIVDYNGILNINLTGQIKYTDYRNLIMELNYKKPVYFVAIGILFLFVLTFLVNSETMMNQLDSYYFMYIYFGIILLLPIVTLFQIKKQYNSNKIFQERLNYKLTNDSIQIIGDTFDSTQKWTRFYQIRITKKFFILHQGASVATILDKKMFSDNEIQEFDNFIRSLKIKRV
jgi:hypothetical protein